jgi:hypothetical protein
MPALLMCPWCRERVLVEAINQEGFCSVCGKSWKLNGPPRSPVVAGLPRPGDARRGGSSSVVNAKE